MEVRGGGSGLDGMEDCSTNAGRDSCLSFGREHPTQDEPAVSSHSLWDGARGMKAGCERALISRGQGGMGLVCPSIKRKEEAVGRHCVQPDSSCAL